MTGYGRGTWLSPIFQWGHKPSKQSGKELKNCPLKRTGRDSPPSSHSRSPGRPARCLRSLCALAAARCPTANFN